MISRFRRRQSLRNKKIVPVDYVEPVDPVIFQQDEPEFAIERQNSNSVMASLPIAENYNPDILLEEMVERPQPIIFAKVVGEDKSCCLPGRYSRNCRVCPDEARELPERMQKRGGKKKTRRLKKRITKKRRNVEKDEIKKRNNKTRK